MKLPREEFRALMRAKRFLLDLMVGPRLPTKVIRDRADSCLHHWPLVLGSRYPELSDDEKRGIIDSEEVYRG